MPSALQKSRDILARGVASVRGGLREAVAQQYQPGPEIKVQPFDAANVSTPAALIKLGTAISAGRREQANFDLAREQLAATRAAAQDAAALESDKTRAEIAGLRAQALYDLGEGRQPNPPTPPSRTSFAIGKYPAGSISEDVRLGLSNEANERAAAAAAGDKPTLAGLNTLSDNFTKDKNVVHYGIVRDNYKRILNTAALGSGQGDLAMIFSFMRVLDPESVVRETEFKNAESAVGYLQKVKNYPSRWFNGTRLTEDGRRGFVAAAKNLHDTQLGTYKSTVNMYEDAARQFKQNPRLFIPQYNDVTPAPASAPPPGAVIEDFDVDASGKYRRRQ